MNDNNRDGFINNSSDEEIYAASVMEPLDNTDEPELDPVEAAGSVQSFDDDRESFYAEGDLQQSSSGYDSEGYGSDSYNPDPEETPYAAGALNYDEAINKAAAIREQYTPESMGNTGRIRVPLETIGGSSLTGANSLSGSYPARGTYPASGSYPARGAAPTVGSSTVGSANAPAGSNPLGGSKYEEGAKPGVVSAVSGVKRSPSSNTALSPQAIDTSQTKRIPKLGDTQKIPQIGNTRKIPIIPDSDATMVISQEEIRANLSKSLRQPVKAADSKPDFGIEEEAYQEPSQKANPTIVKSKKRKSSKQKSASIGDNMGNFAEALGTLVGRIKRGIARNRIAAFAILGVVIVVIAVAAIVAAVRKSPEEGENPQETASAELEHAPEMDLDEDAIPGINELMGKYYDASARGDVDTILKLQDYVSDLEKIRIEKKSEYIEAFENISCYTKEGPVDGTYLLYAYNEVKLKDIDTLAPALNTYVIYTGDGGDYYIHEGDLDESTLTYFQELSTQDNVTNLCNTVQAKYNEAIAADQNLSDFMDAFPGLIQEAVANASNGTENIEEQEAEEAAAAEEQNTPVVAEVEATDRVNVRVSDSQESDRVGQVEKGTRLPLLEKKGNGWSKVRFEGQDGYIKSEFLIDVGTAEGAGTSEGNDSPDNAQNADAGNDSRNDSNVSTTPVGKKMRAAANVNIRAAAQETAEKLGTLSGGQSIEVVEHRSDGWSKVRYNGRDAYLKTEYLE